MADHMIKFLDKFFDMFPEYESDDVSFPSFCLQLPLEPNTR